MRLYGLFVVVVDFGLRVIAIVNSVVTLHLIYRWIDICVWLFGLVL